MKAPAGVDPMTPSVARMYDYYLGGKDNFASDREAAQKILEILPNLRDIARENREFLVRTVSYLTERGIRQFLDIGAGLPTQRNVHQVAQELAPESKVVYVDNDPIVLVHARALLAENERVIAVGADLRDAESLVRHPEVLAHLDFTQPVAVLLLGVLHFVPDDDEAARIVASLRAPLVSGGYLAISHGSIGPLSEGQEEEGRKVFDRTAVPGTTSRSRDQVLAFFDGLDLVEPGVVALQDWRPDPDRLAVREGKAGALGGVARVI
ncbi:SAM-dependent methyltransferase [Microbispora sp. RL4-1S]|uniref:SAM-dependent methyltransferase n=1 Tax=Microbispora oryzae TaxID=2806554 RepID=A0A940WWK5_9ACTN|nr:SAM-dependent methyltransferase [Microbispora oryzae]MBP2708651.1 SAM-dependent methyltransferase [Microbispora oryzae]